MVTIDGRAGEGGGQVLRTALALSAALGIGFRITHIRENRRSPGLKAQHLTAVRAVAELCAASVAGDELGSRELRFEPGRPKPGRYRVQVGTAGATTLVAQAAVPPLLRAPAASQLDIEGGTHVAWAPPFDYVEGVLHPTLGLLGCRPRAHLDRLGFYPRGGGAIRVEIPADPGAPAGPRLFLKRPPVERIGVRLTAWVSSLPRHIGRRMLETGRSILGAGGWALQDELHEASGPAGAYMFIRVAPRDEVDPPVEAAAWIAGGFTGLGERGKPAERVAQEAARAAASFLAGEATLDAHLADQILVPAILLGAELTFRTERITSHLETNAATITHFVGERVRLEPGGVVRISSRIPAPGS